MKDQRKLKAEKALERKSEVGEAISEKIAEHFEEKLLTVGHYVPVNI